MEAGLRLRTKHMRKPSRASSVQGLLWGFTHATDLAEKTGEVRFVAAKQVDTPDAKSGEAPCEWLTAEKNLQ